MANKIKIINNEEIDIRALFQLFLKKRKFILFILCISLLAGLLYGLYFPKKYESTSILSIGKIYNLQISTPKDLSHTLDLIPIIGYTDYLSSDKVKYGHSINGHSSKSNLTITTISQSPKRAFTFNRAILDTILNRHNHLVNNAIKPIELAIMNISTQIDYINNSLEKERQMEEKLTSLSLLNQSKIQLLKEKNRIVHTRIVIHPQIPKKHTEPILYLSIIISFFLGLLIAIIMVLIKNHFNQNIT